MLTIFNGTFSFFKRQTSGLLDLVFPRHCCFCGKAQENSEFSFICDSCSKGLVYIGPNICENCGEDFGESSILHYQKSCPRCLSQKFSFECARSVLKLNHIAKEMIHLFKYQNGEYLVNDLCKMAKKNEQFVELISNAVLIPVPLHWKRKFLRDYNQSEVFAKALSELPINSSVKSLLIRPKQTSAQVNLSAEERHFNVQGAFKYNKNSEINKNQKIVIIDDVFTTGATLNECARELIKNGFLNVSVATLART